MDIKTETDDGLDAAGAANDVPALRVALAHDWLVGMRGGELVLDRLARQFGPTTLYTLVHDYSRTHTDAIEACDIITSPLQRWPRAATSWRRAYLPLMPRAVEQLCVQPCDLLISTSSAVMKSINPPPGVPHLCYCHSPARYIWEQGDDYAVGRGGIVRRAGLRALRRRFQRWDYRTADRVTRFLANSHHTARRIERCYGREAHVVHPPVRTDFFTLDQSVAREDFLLVVSALEPYKRVDLVIDAANRTRTPLVIAGVGSQAAALNAVAGSTVQMLGRVDDDALRSLYRRARAFVFPQLEDFGITAVEAQACGCPVVAFRGGGALDTVTDDTGVFIDAQTADDLLTALRDMEQRSFESATIRRNAERFSESRFDDAVRDHVEAVIGAKAQTPA